MSEDIEDIEELRETLREEISELREDITLSRRREHLSSSSMMPPNAH